MSAPSYPSAADAEVAALTAARIDSLRAAAAVAELVHGAEQTIERIRAANTSSWPDLLVHQGGALIDPTLLDTANAQNQAILTFMERQGMAGELVSALDALIRLNATVAAAERPAVASPGLGRTGSLVDTDPFEPLSAAEMGVRLHLVAASVRLREQAGDLFSTLPPGRERGREYPAFQAWPAIAGAPLRQVLQALGQPDGPTAWGFFSSTSPELEQLTPVEVLSGRLVRARTISDSAQALLGAHVDVRREVVQGAAQAFAAVRAA